MRSLLTLFFASVCLMAFTTVSTYKIGDPVADFSLKNVDGKMVATQDYKKAKGFIIVFTCNHCPFAKRYQERLNAFDKKYKPMGIPVLAISATDEEAVPDDSWENMVVRAKEQKYTFPYLLDKTQQVAKAFNAVKTPHAFVVFKENGKLVLKYSGAIDDNGAEPEKVQNHYLENAVDALLAGKEVPVSATKSIGCPIKWKQ
jgi:peroxiredoxin